MGLVTRCVSASAWLQVRPSHKGPEPEDHEQLQTFLGQQPLRPFVDLRLMWHAAVESGVSEEARQSPVSATQRDARAEVQLLVWSPATSQEGFGLSSAGRAICPGLGRQATVEFGWSRRRWQTDTCCAKT